MGLWSLASVEQLLSDVATTAMQCAWCGNDTLISTYWRLVREGGHRSLGANEAMLPSAICSTPASGTEVSQHGTVSGGGACHETRTLCDIGPQLAAVHTHGVQCL